MDHGLMSVFLFLFYYSLVINVGESSDFLVVKENKIYNVIKKKKKV